MSQNTFVGALIGAALLAGCGGDGTTSTPETSGQGMTWEQFMSVVHQGEDGVFVANGDETFESEKELREFYELQVKTGQLILHRPGGVDAKWSDTQKLNLTYCVSSTFGSNYNRAVADMTAAANAWEAVGNVNFIHVTAQDSNCTASNTNVLFDVRPVNSGGQYLARAFFPDSSRSARNVLIDNTAFGNNPPWTLAGILRHELGHVLGFRHEHTRPESGTCFEDNNWRALTAYDSASVMHYPQCNGSQSGDLVITARDQEGIVVLYGAPGQPPPPPPTGTPVQETRSGSVAQNANVNYGPFSVVAGTSFKVVMTGTGDPDLYVQFGTAPTTAAYACRPYLNGAAETCDVTVPSGQTTAYIMVRGYSSATFSLTINYTKPGTGTGTPRTDTKTGSVSAGQIVNFPAYSVLAGTTFKVVMTGSGDPDLYVQFGAAPTTTAYACRPYLNGAAETCELTVPSGQTTAYIMVRGYSSATFSLTINYTKPGTSTGTPRTDTKTGSVSAGQIVNFPAYSVVAGTTFKVVMTGSGDPDLYVQFGAAPTTTAYACRPYLNGAAETCELTVPSGQTSAYVMVQGYTAGSYTLNINYTSP